MKFFIDAGHGGTDVGAVGKNGTFESHVNLKVALLLGALLQKSGHEVAYSRQEDIAVSLSDRANLANTFGADLFISIHCNSSKEESANGTEVFCYREGTKAEAVAERIQECLVKALGSRDRGVKTANFAVLRQTDMTAVLVELLFISNPDEEKRLKDDVFSLNAAKAIYEGAVGMSYQDQSSAQKTVMRLDNIWVQEIAPDAFGIYVCDCPKQNVGIKNYFNLGFFASLKGGGTIPVGNLAYDGNIVAQSKDNPSWINVAKKKLTTIYTTLSGKAHIVKTDDLSKLKDLKDAVSGIPIIRSGKYVDMDTIKAEGYSGDELYNTWHGFLGIRQDKLVYVAMQCGFSQMCWNLVALGIYDAIKLDGGGSFILFNGSEVVGTSENRRINNVGMWG